MKAPSVSFVVICYRTEKYVGEAIASILAQEKYSDFEIVAVDDASPDGTVDVLRSIGDPRLRVLVNERNLGPMPTVERGLREARGKYVTRFDSDDRYRPNFLKTLVPILDRHPDVAFAYGDAAMIGPDGEIREKKLDRHHQERDFHGSEWLALLEHNFICNPAVITRREAWLEALPIPPGTVLGDWHLSTAIARKHNFYYCDEVVAEYRIHPGNYHSQTFLDGREERQVIGYLERVFSEQEASPEQERAKRAAARRIWARNYRTLADKYFGAGKLAEARRCYWQAIRKGHDLSLTGLRRLGATYLNPEQYAKLKRRLA
jgi:glycosyltransferase involved in cell wall biosynthesis